MAFAGIPVKIENAGDLGMQPNDVKATAPLQAAASGDTVTLSIAVDTANGVPTLDGSGKIKASELPAAAAPAWGDITGTLSAQTDLQTALDAKLDPADVVGDSPMSVNNQAGVVHVALAPGTDGQAIVTLNGTPTWGNQTANAVGAIATNTKGVANGVATLGADGKVPAGQLPTPPPASGSTRPTNPTAGQMFFDTTLSPPVPIWWDGTQWVDASGTTPVV